MLAIERLAWPDGLRGYDKSGPEHSGQEHDETRMAGWLHDSWRMYHRAVAWEPLAWWAATLGCFALVGSHGVVYWDSFSYVTQALSGDIGGLGLGRPVFAIVSTWVADFWLYAGGSVWDLEPVLRWWWAAVTALSAPVTLALAHEAGLSPRASRMAAALIVTSPALAHAGFAVLTDGPASTCVLVAVWAGLRLRHRGLVRDACVAGAMLGLAVGVREAAAVMGIVVLSASGWRPWRLVHLTAVAGLALVAAVITPMAWAAYTTPWYVESIRNWMTGLDHDRQLQQWGLRQVGFLLAWVLTLSPIGVVAAVLATSQWQDIPAMVRRVWLPSVFVLAAMSTHHSATYSPRYLLIACPMAIALPAAWWLDRCVVVTTGRRRALMAALAVQVAAASWLIGGNDAPVREVTRTMPDIVRAQPPDAVIVTGLACAGVQMTREQHNRAAGSEGEPARWDAICPGWSWPSDPDAAFSAVVADGRPLVLDVRPHAWRGDEQRRALAQVQAFAARRLPGVRLIE